MEWYRYNPVTHEYEHPVICQPNPARPGEFLIPPSAIELKPPSTQDHEIAVFQTDSNNWMVKPDYRGNKYWLPDGSHHKIEQIGEVPPEDALDEQPPPPPPTPEEQFQEMKRQRNQMLNDSDWIVMRHKDQLELDVPTTMADSAYKATLQWRQQLRDMPESFSASKTRTKTKAKTKTRTKDAQPHWIWPPIPPELQPDFPDYPPDI